VGREKEDHDRDDREARKLHALQIPRSDAIKTFERAAIEALLTPTVGALEAIIWEDAGSQIQIDVAKTRIDFTDGFALIGFSVHTDQVPSSEVIVPFALGTPDRPTGLIAATETTPRGPSIIVARWGDAFIAAAWKILLTAVQKLANGAVPASLNVAKDSLELMLHPVPSPKVAR
jgi:hypothetical protein